MTYLIQQSFSILSAEKTKRIQPPCPCPAAFCRCFERLEDKDLKGVKIGLPKEYFSTDGITEDVQKGLDDTIATLKKLGAEIVEVSLPHTKYAVSVYYIIATAEASANLARFDAFATEAARTPET